MLIHGKWFVELSLHKKGFVLLSDEKEYTNNSKIKYMCLKCGKIGSVLYSSFRYKGIICKHTRKPHKKKPPKVRSKGYSNWRLEIKERDRWKCRRCGSPHFLNVHHPLEVSNHIDLVLDAENGITWCQDCHEEFHKEYGYTELKKEWSYEFTKTTK